ncbi:MAG: hypothetical protein R2827_13940 [Bdellovibrionales bacterium]
MEKGRYWARPSTYATIIGTIQDKGYVKKNGKHISLPTFTALVVSKLLSNYLTDLCGS